MGWFERLVEKVSDVPDCHIFYDVVEYARPSNLVKNLSCYCGWNARASEVLELQSAIAIWKKHVNDSCGCVF